MSALFSSPPKPKGPSAESLALQRKQTEALEKTKSGKTIQEKKSLPKGEEPVDLERCLLIPESLELPLVERVKGRRRKNETRDETIYSPV